jgi:murein DD-endopeptidase MepM/ murein hydrolase activator NlpD
MNRCKRVSRNVFAVLVALVLALYGPVAIVPMPTQAATQSDYDALKKEQQQLEKEQEKLKEQIAQAGNSVEAQKKKLDALKQQISNVEKQIATCTQQLDVLNLLISKKDAEISGKEEQINATEQEISGRFETLRRRINALSKTGDLSSMQLLFDGKEYIDYLLKAKLIETIAKRDQQLMDQLTEELEKIHKQKEEILTEREDLQVLYDEMAKVQAANDAKKAELDALYVSAKKIEADLQKQLGTYQKEQEKLEKEAEELEKEIQEALKELQQTNTGKYNGTMQWPVPTVLKISSYYGPRWGTTHGGIDIANGKAAGEKIYPAADGKVILSRLSPSYGNYCMISHGKDSKGREIVTLYAHMQTMYAKKGDVVQAGKTVLGLIGSTGNSTGPHLHFEVRENDVRVDPIANGYLKDPNKK